MPLRVDSALDRSQLKRQRPEQRLALAVTAVFALFAAPSHATAQTLPKPVELQLASNATRVHLERFARFIADKQWSEAVDTLSAVLESPSDELVLLEGEPNDFARYVPIREYCHRQLVRLARDAPAALEAYRNRIDPLAKRWLDEGLANGDAASLERVVRQLYASRHTDQALLALGDLALERGQFQLAREYWRQITPEALTPTAPSDIPGAMPDRSLWLGGKDIAEDVGDERLKQWLGEPRQSTTRLVYPDSDLPAADTLARLVLASVMEGSLDRATLEIRVLRLTHPTAVGRLSGRSGKWTKLLGDFLDSSRKWSQPAEKQEWTQFAGALGRTASSSQQADPGMRAVWSAPLEVETAENEALAAGRERTGESVKRLYSVHPLVLGDRVYVPQQNSVLSFDLATGSPGFLADNTNDAIAREVYRHHINPQATDEVLTFGVARYTLSSHKRFLFARVGSPYTCWPRGREEPLKQEQWGAIVGLDLGSQGKLLPGFPLHPDGSDWAFDGVPVCDGSSLYVAMRHRDPARVELHVACFETATGRRKWRTRLASRDPYGEGFAGEISHTLLTLDNGRLLVNSNIGAIGSLRVADGAVDWVTSYPRQQPRPVDIDKSDRHFFRDLNPCVTWRGLVIAAPTDCDRVFALEQATGRIVWALRPGIATDATHILGVADGVLLLGGDSLYWIDAASGEALCQFPPSLHRGDGFALHPSRGQGRGVLSGGNVYFPTEKNILVFRQQPRAVEGGWMPVSPRAPISLVSRGLQGGNLVVAGRYLLVAGHDRFYAFSTTPVVTGREETGGVQ